MFTDGTFEAANPPLRILRDVEFRHLVALKAVADERSFGRAAERLGFTQSAISQQISNLERMVGEPLFDRPGGPRPVSLTAAGTLLLSHAKDLLEALQAADADLVRHRAGQVGSLAVGTYQSVSVRVLPELVTRLRVSRPDLEIRLFESDDQDALLDRLVDGRLDVTFVVEPAGEGDFEVTHLMNDSFVLLSPLESDLGDVRPVPAERLSGVPLIGQQPNACQRLIEERLAGVGVEAHIVFRSADNTAVQAMVRSGMGHAVMPLLAIDPTDPGILVRSLAPDIPERGIGVAVPTRRHLSPAVTAFVEMASEVCAQLSGAELPAPV